LQVTEQVTPGAPVEPEKKGGVGKWIAAVGGVIVVAAIVFVVRFGLSEIMAFFSGDTTKAEVGNCITESADANDMKIVDCSKPEAAFKVAGVVDDKTKAEAETSCEPFPTAESYLFQWEGNDTPTDTTKGQVLCLEPNQK
jgi:hypothetical protein